MIAQIFCMWSCKYSDRVSCSQIFEECVGWRRLMLYKVVSRFDSSILICYLQLHTNYHTRLSCPRCPAHNLYFRPPSPTFRYLLWTPNIDVNCHPGVCLYCSDVSLRALFTHSCRVSLRSEGSDDGFIYTALASGPAIISEIITNFENRTLSGQALRACNFFWCPLRLKSSKIHCNLQKV